MAEILNVDEIRELIAAYSEVRAYIRSLRRRSPVSAHIKMPQIPRALSESLAALLISRGLVTLPNACGQVQHVERSGRRGDPDLFVRTTAKVYRVEVKAAADQEFIEITKKDLLADYLVWLLFGKSFDTGNIVLRVLIVRNPGEVLGAVKVTRDQLVSRCKNHVVEFMVDLQSISD